MTNFLNILLYFIIYSFLGWICETVYCSIYDKRFVNRGFVRGPVCPIYGFGSLAIIYIVTPLSTSLIGIFFLGMIITSIIEYFSSYLLELTFHTSWWDYSNEKFNINGRVCLKNSIFFGILSVCLSFFIHPYISNFVLKFNRTYALVICVSFAIIFFLDFTSTAITISNLQNKLKSIENIKDILRNLKASEKRLIQAFPKLHNKRYNFKFKHINKLLRKHK